MAEVKVLSRTQRIVVSPNKAVSVVNAGPPGPPGKPGLQGPAGPPGAGSGGTRWYGEGPPSVIVGAQPNDEYVDTLTGDLYVLT